MGRPREFDEIQVLEKAMTAFWANGYEATSLTDLVNATGLHKGSLYQAFGNKHDLFITALSRYLEGMHAQKTALLKGAKTPRDGVRSALHGMLDMSDADASYPKGCMAINALVEMAPHDAEVAKVLENHIQRMVGSMVDAITEGQALGQIRTDRPARVIAGLLLTFMSGLATQIKGPALTKDLAHELLEAQLSAVL